MAEGGGEAAGFIVAPAAVVASESSSDAIVVGPGPPLAAVENDDVVDFTDHVLSGAEGSDVHCSLVPMVSGAEVKALSKSEAMDSPDFIVARLLNKLDQSLDHNRDGQFEQLVLAVILMGLPIGLVENAKSIGEIRTAMTKCKVFNGKPLTWLQALLEIVDAKAEFVTKLHSPRKDLDECRKKLGFANVVVRICQGLDANQFAALKELAQPFLEPKNPVNIQSKVELFRYLSEREQLKDSNVDTLAELMKEIGREDLIANLIEPFKRTENPVTEESEEPATDSTLLTQPQRGNPPAPPASHPSYPSHPPHPSHPSHLPLGSRDAPHQHSVFPPQSQLIMATKTSSEAEDINYKLNRVDNHLNEVHRRRLRLAAILAGIPEGSIDAHCAQGEPPSLQNIYQRLKEHELYSRHPMAALRALLKFASLSVAKIELLPDEDDLTKYYEEYMSYSQLIVELCQELTDEEFRTLRNFATDHLDCDAGNIATLEDMFLMLHQNKDISRDEPKLLIEWMGEIKRKDLTEKVNSAVLLPNSPDFTVAWLLHKLDQSLDHNRDGQFEQLVLAVILMGLPIGLVENAKSLGEIRTAMTKCKVFNGKPLTWLQALLEIVDAKAEFVAKLDSPRKDLDECRKKLGFAFVVVRICQGLDTSQFAALKELAQPFLEPKNPVHIQSKVELFRFLSEREQCNVDTLAELMKEIGREDLIANLIEPFKRTENPVTEESEEPAIAVAAAAAAAAAAAVAAVAMSEGFIEVQQMNVALLGAGGAGKTSTLSALVGKKPPSVYTSTDVYSNPTRVASVQNPSDSVRAVTTANRVLIPCGGSLTPDCFTWLLGNKLLRLIARGANANLDEAKRSITASRLSKTPVEDLTAKPSSLVHVHGSGGSVPDAEGSIDYAGGSGEQILASSTGGPVPEVEGCVNHARIKEIGKDVRSQATELMKLSTSEPLAKVRIINFIDSGGQLQFSEIFPTLSKNVNGSVFVLDATKDPKTNIEDQFFINGKPVGKPYKSQYTNELLFKRSLQALQQCEKSPFFSVVATHPDQVNPADLPGRIKELNDWVESILATTGMKNDVIFSESLRDIVFVLRADNPSDDDLSRVRKLLQSICDKFLDTSLVQVHRIPLQQFLLEEAMRKLGEGRKGVLSIEECRELARAINMPLESVDKALRHLSSCNLILYFPELVTLKDVVFCEVQTLLSIITQLVQYSAKLRGECHLDSIPTPNVAIGKCNADFATHGTISEELLAMDTFALCFDANFSAAQFIDLMEYVEIVGLVDPASHQYIMPCILPEMGAADLGKYRMSGDSVAALLLYFGKWPQSGIFCSLIARLGSLYNWKPQPFRNLRPPRLYRNCMKLIPPQLPCTITLIESYDCGYFEVHIECASIDDYKQTCPKIKHILREALNRANLEDGFLCEMCAEDSSQHAHVTIVNFKDLQLSTDRYLRCSLTGRVALFTGKHACWFEQADIDTQVVSPDGVAALMELLVTDLAGSWELFVGQLGVSRGVRDQIKRDNANKPDFSKHCLQSGLSCWVNSDDLPTYSKISAVLRGKSVTNIPLAQKIERLTGCSQGLSAQNECSSSSETQGLSPRKECSSSPESQGMKCCVL